MDKFTFGLTVMVVGMGGTIIILGLMSILMVLLKKMFPLQGDEKSPDKSQSR